MAIRKPARSASNPEPEPQVGRWPYPVQWRRLKVQQDGTIRIPLTFARMFALEGGEVEITLFSDGHIEMTADRVDEHNPVVEAALEDVRAGRVTRQYSDEEFEAELERRSRE